MAVLYEIPRNCPECSSDKIRYNEKNAELYCLKCGYIITEQLPDYNEFKPCVNIVLSETKKTWFAVYPNSVLSKKERNIKPVITELENITSLLNIPAYAKREAMDIYMKIYEKGFTNGRDRIILVCSCLLIAIRDAKIPILLSDFKVLCNKKPEKILDYAEQICRLINIKMASPYIEGFIQRFGYELGLKVITISVAGEIIDELKEKELVNGWTFQEICAGALLLAGKVCNNLVEAERISKIAEVETEKIVNIAKEMMFGAEFDVLKKIVEKFF